MPSSPSRPCSAMNAASGSRSRSSRDELGVRRRSRPPRARGAPAPPATCAPERSETVALQRPAALEHGHLCGGAHRSLRRRAGRARASRRGSATTSASGAARRRCARRSAARPRRAARAGATRSACRAGPSCSRIDLADAADALADVLLGDAREVQAHRGRAAAPVHVGRAAGHERDALALARLREQVGRVDALVERRPDEQAALRPRPARAARRSAPRAPRASRRGGAGRGRFSRSRYVQPAAARRAPLRSSK